MIPTKALYKIIKRFLPDALESYDNSYETRLKTQKLIYIFGQASGIDSYEFSWYLAGPYSSMLTHQIYEDLLQVPFANFEEWDKLQFSDAIELTLSKMSIFFNQARSINKEIDQTRLFELLASIIYIEKHTNFDDIVNPLDKLARIRDKLLLNKPHFQNSKNLDEIIQLVLSNFLVIE